MTLLNISSLVLFVGHLFELHNKLKISSTGKYSVAPGGNGLARWLTSRPTSDHHRRPAGGSDSSNFIVGQGLRILVISQLFAVVVATTAGSNNVITGSQSQGGKWYVTLANPFLLTQPYVYVGL